MRCRVAGPSIVRDSSTIRRPPADAWVRRSATLASMSSHDAGFPFHSGPLSRSSSYIDRTVAWPTAHVPPPKSADSLLPSILIGRPSRVLTSRLHPAEQPPHVVA